MTSVSIQPRDIVFTFTDSCNCCVTCLCCKENIPIDEHLYINTIGELELFSCSKARKNIDLSFERAKRHLQDTIGKRINSLNVDPLEFHRKISTILESVETLGMINKAHIDGINELMLECLTIKMRGK